MPDYMILIREDEGGHEGLLPSEMKALVEAHAGYVRQLRKLGVFRDGERLRPSAEGRRVSSRGVEAGPFSDEQAVAGYYVVRADDLDSAVELAGACPMGPGDSLDVRPVMGGQIRADKASRQGKTFAFAVLGSAENEAAWVGVMDRIDADTHDGPFGERFLGGVRLEAPGRGRQIVAREGKRAVIDGPFLECKEIIGGIFFMRIPDIDEAVEWAKGSKFMKHGPLEVRELWRS